MLFYPNGTKYIVPANGHIPHSTLVQLREKHTVDHNHDRFFRLDQRAKFVVQSQKGN